MSDWLIGWPRTIPSLKAAQRLGVTQPRLNLLRKGKIDKFSIDALVNMLSRAGMSVKMSVRNVA